jgi:hypothetical protein
MRLRRVWSLRLASWTDVGRIVLASARMLRASARMLRAWRPLLPASRFCGSAGVSTFGSDRVIFVRLFYFLWRYGPVGLDAWPSGAHMRRRRALHRMSKNGYRILPYSFSLRGSQFPSWRDGHRLSHSSKHGTETAIEVNVISDITT